MGSTNRNEGTGRTIQSVDASLEILTTLVEAGPMTITEVADDLDRSPSNVLAHLTTLERREFVVEEDNEYRPGLRYYDIGEKAKHGYGIFQHGREPADQLADDIGEYVWLMVEEHGKAYYLYKTGGEQAVESGAYTLGSRWHLNTTAGGKVVLAHMDDEAVDTVIDRHGLGSMTPNSITDREELMAELDTIREEGIAFDDEEAAVGIRSVAAPVRGVDGLIGTITVSGPVSRLDGDRLTETLPRKLREQADIIRIKYNGASATDY
ncbi:IclR family transcriptional regulator [Halorarius halobius]|uniref:IclR family transcriptional regulator n=1 Tax=Halorarius halobius TaxID=2962671 RepID=UPI0020CD29F6|nr:IclR family transcriptional regulator [Halorarius halobius]